MEEMEMEYSGIFFHGKGERERGERKEEKEEVKREGGDGGGGDGPPLEMKMEM